MHYFFIVGAPRSGTTLLQQALNRHSQIGIPPETAFFTFLGLGRKGQKAHLQRLNADLQIALPLPGRRIHRPAEARALFEQMAELYVQRLGRTEITHFGEKSPEHQRRLPRLVRVFPGAKILLIFRDGRDVAWRLTKLPWMSRDLFVNFALWLYYFRLHKKAVQSSQYNLYCVKFETLVRQPEEEFRKILHFLGLPYEPQVSLGYGNVEGIAPWEIPWKASALGKIDPGQIGLWQQELNLEQIQILERWGGSALRFLGYELVTGGKHPLPFLFYPRVFWQSLRWLLCKPRYGSAVPRP